MKYVVENNKKCKKKNQRENEVGRVFRVCLLLSSLGHEKNSQGGGKEAKRV